MSTGLEPRTHSEIGGAGVEGFHRGPLRPSPPPSRSSQPVPEPSQNHPMGRFRNHPSARVLVEIIPPRMGRWARAFPLIPLGFALFSVSSQTIPKPSHGMIPYLLIPHTTPWGGVMGRWDETRKATRLGTGDLSLTALGFLGGFVSRRGRGSGVPD